MGWGRSRRGVTPSFHLYTNSLRRTHSNIKRLTVSLGVIRFSVCVSLLTGTLALQVGYEFIQNALANNSLAVLMKELVSLNGPIAKTTITVMVYIVRVSSEAFL